MGARPGWQVLYASDVDTWSYYTLVIKNPGVFGLDQKLNALGAEGWELTTSLTTVKTWVNVTGNDLVLLFKKRGANVQPSSAAIVAILGVDPSSEGAWG